MLDDEPDDGLITGGDASGRTLFITFISALLMAYSSELINRALLSCSREATQRSYVHPAIQMKSKAPVFG